MIHGAYNLVYFRYYTDLGELGHVPSGLSVSKCLIFRRLFNPYNKNFVNRGGPNPENVCVCLCVCVGGGGGGGSGVNHNPWEENPLRNRIFIGHLSDEVTYSETRLILASTKYWRYFQNR